MVVWKFLFLSVALALDFGSGFDFLRKIKF